MSHGWWVVKSRLGSFPGLALPRAHPNNSSIQGGTTKCVRGAGVMQIQLGAGGWWVGLSQKQEALIPKLFQ